MSCVQCELCDKVIDTDFQMETDGHGNCICDRCWEETSRDEVKETDEAVIEIDELNRLLKLCDTDPQIDCPCCCKWSDHARQRIRELEDGR